MEKKPILTIGMIFKNEIRCLERCLEALRPLRDAIPCELVMADTGSDDGSREVAERYADVLFDFPWIDDFSAARNAVMDRASGEWYMTVDADEYLDPDVSELAGFLSAGGRGGTAGTVIVRNYFTLEMDGGYSDFAALRLLKLSTGLRYQGVIHEVWAPKPGRKMNMKALAKTILHHDGYAGLNTEQGRAKRQRNLKLLRRELEKDPKDLRRLMQYIESGMKEPDALDKVRYAAGLVEEKVPGWKAYGPSVFRHAVFVAVNEKLPEAEAWTRRALDWFPDSFYTRIDVAMLAFVLNWNQKQDYAACVRWGEMYFAACIDYDRDLEKQNAFYGGPVTKASPADRESMRGYLANAYVEEALPEKALALLMDMRVDQMDAQKVGDLTDTVLSLHSHSPGSLDTAPLVRKLWEGVNDREDGRDTSMKRRFAFLSGCARVFSAGYRASEAEDNIQRPAYTALLPLADVCAAGIGAAVLESRDPAEIAELLGRVERWNELPHAAVIHAVRAGVQFPPPGVSLYLEELDELAAHAAQDPEAAPELLEKALEGADCSWARALALAQVNTCKWEDEEAGLRLARQFAKAEAAFLPLCYASEALGVEKLPFLPPMHRFGWYCARAFEDLDGGDAAGYARCLRQGLNVCESAKPMVEFLLEHTPELQVAPPPPPNPELLELAEKVRTMLAAFPADDPAVAALKASQVYQEVAHLIEV